MPIQHIRHYFNTFYHFEINLLTALSTIFAIYTVILLLLEQFTNLNPEIIRIIVWVDLSACLIFFSEFCYGLWCSPSKSQYLKTHWILIFTFIPIVESLRFTRIFIVIRVIRLLIITNHARNFFSYRRNYEIKMLFTIVLAIYMVSLSIFTILILHVEAGAPDQKIITAEDAIWWVVSTISTVGYGDVYPTTSAGRVVGMFLMTIGVTLFATLSGIVSSWLFHIRKN
ncbi:MAG: ion channel [Methylacidiphilales bacterium]|nr:ion channel [Candidatus Methylacidiphilales bacterium]